MTDSDRSLRIDIRLQDLLHSSGVILTDRQRRVAVDVLTDMADDSDGREILLTQWWDVILAVLGDTIDERVSRAVGLTGRLERLAMCLLTDSMVAIVESRHCDTGTDMGRSSVTWLLCHAAAHARASMMISDILRSHHAGEL